MMLVCFLSTPYDYCIDDKNKRQGCKSRQAEVNLQLLQHCWHRVQQSSEWTKMNGVGWRNANRPLGRNVCTASESTTISFPHFLTKFWDELLPAMSSCHAHGPWIRLYSRQYHAIPLNLGFYVSCNTHNLH